MPPRTAEQLHREGSRVIQRNRQNVVEIRDWLRGASEKFNDCANESCSKGTRMDAAFDAILYCSFALLCAQGWRAGSEPGHNKEVIETMAATLRPTETQLDEVDSIRGWRNRKYRGPATPEDFELKTATDWARRISERTATWLRKNQPRVLKD